MSVKFFEGFDLYGDWSDPEKSPFVRREMWRTSESVSGLSFQSRNNGNAMRLNTDVTNNLSSYTFIRLVTQDNLNLTHFICGFAFMKESVGSSADRPPHLIKFDAAYTDSNYFLVEAFSEPLDLSIRFSFYDAGGPGLIVDETITGIEAGIWHYVEVELNLDAPQKYVKGWINGAEVVNADINPTFYWDKLDYINICPAKEIYHTGGIWYDDFYLLDASDASQGSVFQNRLGPIQIRPVPLTADSGASNWVASGGGAKYLEVDEQPGASDLDATYISVDSAPQTQLFDVQTYDASLPIIALTSFAAVKQPDPTLGVANLSFVADSEVTPNPAVLQNVYRLISNNYVTLPGGALTAAVVDATKFGIRSEVG